MSHQLIGDTNPALCALKALRYFSAVADEQSFIAVAQQINYKWKPEDSFMVHTVFDLSKLCALGGFSIRIGSNGVFRAQMENTQTLTLKVDASMVQDAIATTVPVLGEILGEQSRALEIHGGVDVDDARDPDHWLGQIGYQTAEAACNVSQVCVGERLVSPTPYRDRLVRIAALAISAIEAHDRVNMPSDLDE